MVLPTSSKGSPRPNWAKTNSWRQYIKTPSNRKLHVDLMEPRTVTFSEESPVVYLDSTTTTTTTTRSIMLPDLLDSSTASYTSTCSSSDEVAMEDGSADSLAACSMSASASASASADQAARWYTKSDYEAFEKDRQLTALQYRAVTKRGAPYIERDHSVRGLEELLEVEDDSMSSSSRNANAATTTRPTRPTTTNMTTVPSPPTSPPSSPPPPPPKKKSTTSREEHLQKILQEQQRQKAAGCYPNDAMFREVSLKSSREARHRSAALGEADALAGYVSSSRAVQRQVRGMMRSISRKMQG